MAAESPRARRSVLAVGLIIALGLTLGILRILPWEAGAHVLGYDAGNLGVHSTSLTLSPDTATRAIGTQHCVTATVYWGSALHSDVPVRFFVTGTVTTSGVGNGSGATFCYAGPTDKRATGTDKIRAFADDNNNGDTRDPGEATDTATATWVKKLKK